jgi:hypothetical protein
MKHIVYLSTAVYLMTDDELADILTVARTNNSKIDVTGILLYSGGTFIQVLEGMPEVINKLLKTIEDDLRHKNIIVIVDEDLEKRNFQDWSMGYSTIDIKKGKELIGYLKTTDEIKSSDSANRVFSILQTFINTNNLVISS